MNVPKKTLVYKYIYFFNFFVLCQTKPNLDYQKGLRKTRVRNLGT